MAEPGSGYSWFITDSMECVCYPSPDGWQHIAAFAESSRRAKFHDDALAGATQQINGIMTALESRNDDSTRVLSIIAVPGGQLMLVWAKAEHPVGPHSDGQTIADALGMRNTH
jgi:hypothetical protein